MQPTGLHVRMVSRSCLAASISRPCLPKKMLLNCTISFGAEPHVCFCQYHVHQQIHTKLKLLNSIGLLELSQPQSTAWVLCRPAAASRVPLGTGRRRSASNTPRSPTPHGASATVLSPAQGRKHEESKNARVLRTFCLRTSGT